ncbi:uncharacterized protein B0H18DRAFT_141259 [Fomitopsis serialis]|uniref:uncharacterized protein n=1 Tax=Fomitopsis serialis TaxID=139415 RepID=UPI0020087D41|nr:uncharacterized protein B0H18DRAFT_141259 [Neoantrodia serialis]KAH9914129.1 hypothetical protein B0H18DRAFT_141259 [Neoantrodia serialis]
MLEEDTRVNCLVCVPCPPRLLFFMVLIAPCVSSTNVPMSTLAGSFHAQLSTWRFTSWRLLAGQGPAPHRTLHTRRWSLMQQTPTSLCSRMFMLCSFSVPLPYLYP